MKKNTKFNLLYMTPVTSPLFLLGYVNGNIMLTIIGFILLAFFVLGGLIQLLISVK